MAKVQIFRVGVAPAAPAPAADTCATCKYRDPNMMSGATKVFCFRFPRREQMRTTDWCGEYTATAKKEA